MKFILVKGNLFIRQNNPGEYTLRIDSNICGAVLHELNSLLTNCDFKTDKYWPWYMFTCLYCDSVYKHAKQGYNQYPAILTSDSNVYRCFLPGSSGGQKWSHSNLSSRENAQARSWCAEENPLQRWYVSVLKFRLGGGLERNNRNILLLLC